MLTQVAQGVWVHQSELILNNTVVVQGRDGVLLVDAGITGAEMACLANDLAGLGLAVVAGFSTHPDWDHVLWHPLLGEVPRYGTARCAEFMRRFRSDPQWQTTAAEGLPEEIADDTPLELYGLLTALPAGATRIPWDGPVVRVIEHPAHAPGHAALLVEQTAGQSDGQSGGQAGVLVAGDMLSDLLVPMFDDPANTDDPIGDYLSGLEVLAAVADEAAVVVPGHGTVGDADQLRDRIALDRAYVHALRDGRDVFDDPRIDSRAKPGWEWVSDLHTGNLQRFTQQG